MNDRTRDYVFISYSHRDSIETYLDFFDRMGYNVVYDSSLHYGQEWDLMVRRYINNDLCKGVICIISSASLISRAVLQELDYCRLYNKKMFAILHEGSTMNELVESITNDSDREVADFMSEHLDKKKLFLLGGNLTEHSNQLAMTLDSWGMKRIEVRGCLDGIVVEGYSTELEGEKNRLIVQQQGYRDLDRDTLTREMSKIGRDGIVVLDLGCSDGENTYSRFKDLKQVSRVIGVDYNKNDIDSAKSSGYDSRFSFHHLDLDSDDVIDRLRIILRDEHADNIDLIFAGLTLHHLKQPSLLLLRLYDVLAPDGRIVIRAADDGGKMCNPGGEMMSELLRRYNNIVKSSTDRYFGRKLYKLLYDAGYVDINLEYRVVDTCDKDRRDKEYTFQVGFGYRSKKLDGIGRDNPSNPDLQKEIEWQKDALRKLESMFMERDFWYCNITFIATAGVRM